MLANLFTLVLTLGLVFLAVLLAALIAIAAVSLYHTLRTMH